MLRIAAEKDVSAMLAIYAPYVLTSTATFEYDPPDEAEFLRRYRTITAQFPWLLWEEDGRILGYAYASPPYSRAAYAWCAEPTIYLRPEAWGRGIGKALYGALEAILSQQGYYVLYALICSENRNSLDFHEKNGYRTAAFFPDCGFKFDRWLGLIWMEKRLKTGEIPINNPIAWQSIMQNAEFFPDILDTLSLS